MTFDQLFRLIAVIAFLVLAVVSVWASERYATPYHDTSEED